MSDGSPTRTGARYAAFLALVLAILPLASLACATAGGPPGSDSSQRGSSTEIIGPEIREIETSYPTAADVIRNLRPRWLRVRSAQGTTGPISAVVHLDGVRFGGLDSLYRIDSGNIARMTYTSGLSATTRFGTGYGGGVIEVFTR